MNNLITARSITSHWMFLMLRFCGPPMGDPQKKFRVRLSVETTQEKIVLTTDFHNITKMLANVSTRALVGEFNTARTPDTSLPIRKPYRCLVLLPSICVSRPSSGFTDSQDRPKESVACQSKWYRQTLRRPPAKKWNEKQKRKTESLGRQPEKPSTVVIYAVKVTHRLFHSCG